MFETDKVAVSKRMALKMFWDAGYDTESQLLKAAKIIDSIKQCSDGYWYADDISRAII